MFPQSVLEALEKFYNLGEILNVKKLIGLTNENFLLTNRMGERYIVRLSPFYKMKHLWIEMYVLDKLKGLSFPRVPTPLKSNLGTYNIRVGNQAITVFKFIEEETAFPSLSKDLSFSKKLGRMIASLHERFFHIKVPNTNFTHFNLITSYYDQFKFYVSCGYNSHDEWRQILLKKMNVILREFEKYKLYYKKMKGREKFVHTDIRMDNIVIKNRNIVGLIDFDDILVGDHAFDLASMFVEIYCNKLIISQRLEEMADMENFAFMLKEYLNNRRIRIKKEFIKRIVNLINLQALHVLSIVGRDIEFDETQRINNVIWYTNFLEAMNDPRNMKRIENILVEITKP